MQRKGRLSRRTPLKSASNLAPGAPLKPTGKRGKRLAKPYAAAARETHSLVCVCGCGANPDEGEVCASHLLTRSYEATRADERCLLPTCAPLARWLDTDGVRAKGELWRMAQALGRRLEAADVAPVLRRYAYYEWRARYG